MILSLMKSYSLPHPYDFVKDRGLSDKKARILLSCIEEDFNIIFDDMVRSKLLSRIHQIKRGGLGVTLDILFRTMMIGIPSVKEFYNALINDIDR